MHCDGYTDLDGATNVLIGLQDSSRKEMHCSLKLLGR
jgi:hypothetical protein